MTSALYRLLALVAVLLMPLSMAASASAHAAPDMSQPEHCAEHGQQPADAPDPAKMHCAVCAALPALDASAADAGLLPRAPLELALTAGLSGIVLEIATPPPKLS